jgi:4-hydroxybenzoate polyprenyltransferase
MLDKIKKAVTVSRPVFWVLMCFTYAFGAVVSGAEIGYFAMAQMLSLSFPLSFYFFGINDSYDMATDRLNKRKHSRVWGAVLSEKDVPWVKKAAFAAAFAVFALSLFSGNPMNIAIVSAFIALSYAYSAPPIRLKTRPLVDSLVNAAYFFMPFALGYSLSNSTGFMQPQFMVFALSFSAAHAIATVADREEDAQAGISTFATAFGPRVPMLFATAVFIANIPFAFSAIRSAGVLFTGFAAMGAYLSLRPSAKNANAAIKIGIVASTLWIVYFIAAFLAGFEGIGFQALR